MNRTPVPTKRRMPSAGSASFLGFLASLAVLSVPARAQFLNDLWKVQSTPEPAYGSVSTIPQPLVFTPDSQMLLTTNPGPEECTPVPGGGCRTLHRPYRLVKSNTGELVRVFEGGKSEDEISKVFFSPDGKVLIGYRNYNSPSLLLWNVSDGQILKGVGISKFTISHTYDVVFSPDNQYVAVSGDRGFSPETVLLWRTSDATLVQTITVPNPQGDYYEGAEVVFSPDSRFLATTARTSETIQVLNVSDGSLVREIPKTEGVTLASVFPDTEPPLPSFQGTLLAVSPDGKVLVTYASSASLRNESGTNSTVPYWFEIRFVNRADGSVLSTASVSGTNERVRFVFSPDGHFFAYGLDFEFPSPVDNWLNYRLVKTAVARNNLDESIKMGDVNDDDAVDVLDVTTILKILVGIWDGSYYRSDRGDLDGNKAVDVKDAMLLLRQIVGV